MSAPVISPGLEAALTSALASRLARPAVHLGFLFRPAVPGFAVARRRVEGCRRAVQLPAWNNSLLDPRQTGAEEDLALARWHRLRSECAMPRGVRPPSVRLF